SDVSPDDLEASTIVPFGDFNPTVHPHVLICRHILRTLCVCGLLHLEFLISALPARVLVAICQTSLGSSDALMKYLGVSLISILCASRPIAMEFAKVPFILNFVIDKLRAKLAQPGFSTKILLNATTTQGRALQVTPGSGRSGETRWHSQATEFYGFVSALVCIIRIGDIVKDVYATEIDRESLARQLKRKGRGGGVLGRLKAQDAARDEGGEQEDMKAERVSQKNLDFLVTLPAAILGFMDIDALAVLLH
ncbi:hypothetical protein FOZ63_013425, partial [Perkinsus olseni]